MGAGQSAVGSGSVSTHISGSESLTASTSTTSGTYIVPNGTNITTSTTGIFNYPYSINPWGHITVTTPDYETQYKNEMIKNMTFISEEALRQLLNENVDIKKKISNALFNKELSEVLREDEKT